MQSIVSIRKYNPILANRFTRTNGLTRLEEGPRRERAELPARSVLPRCIFPAAATTLLFPRSSYFQGTPLASFVCYAQSRIQLSRSKHGTSVWRLLTQKEREREGGGEKEREKIEGLDLFIF